MGTSAFITGMKCNFGVQLEVVIVATEIGGERGPTDGQQRRLGVCPKLNFKPRGRKDKVDFYHLNALFFFF